MITYLFPEFGSKAVVALKLLIGIGLLPLRTKIKATLSAGYIDGGIHGLGLFWTTLQTPNNKLQTWGEMWVLESDEQFILLCVRISDKVSGDSMKKEIIIPDYT